MKYIIFLLAIFTLGCSNSQPKNIEWKGIRLFSENNYKNVDKNLSIAKKGDIIIKEAEGGFLGWMGHAGIVTEDNLVAEIPKFGTNLHYNHISKWESERKIALLRYKYGNDEFIAKLIDKIDDNIGKPYRIFTKNYSRGYYCSQFVWYMYYYTGQDFNIFVDIDSNGGFFVLPKDILMSEELEIIYITQ